MKKSSSTGSSLQHLQPRSSFFIIYVHVGIQYMIAVFMKNNNNKTNKNQRNFDVNVKLAFASCMFFTTK